MKLSAVGIFALAATANACCDSKDNAIIGLAVSTGVLGLCVILILLGCCAYILYDRYYSRPTVGGNLGNNYYPSAYPTTYDVPAGYLKSYDTTFRGVQALEQA